MPPKSTNRRRPTQDRAKATREDILDAAAALFGERGITDTSTNRIAAAAGVSIGTVYRYFPDRATIVEELLTRIQNNIERRFTERAHDLSDTPVQQLVSGVLEAIVDEMVTDVPLVRALIAGLDFYSSGMPELEVRLRLLVKMQIIQILGPGADDEYDVLTITIISACFGIVLRAAVLEDRHIRDEVIATTARLVAAFADNEIQARTTGENQTRHSPAAPSI
ncbi:TetR/AcrR family transcriptional regulator [Nocardia sp. NPDC023988]|uniref:TetR/AcrR family transcriptional regulator n=1 Tax=unclassified Nocardia TaxID=2637762 RepID=UPI00340278D4